jgi:hypothetical protein
MVLHVLTETELTHQETIAQADWLRGRQDGEKCKPRASQDQNYFLGYEEGLTAWMDECDRQIAKLPGGVGAPYEAGAGDVRLRAADPWSDCDWLYEADYDNE